MIIMPTSFLAWLQHQYAFDSDAEPLHGRDEFNDEKGEKPIFWEYIFEKFDALGE